MDHRYSHVTRTIIDAHDGGYYRTAICADGSCTLTGHGLTQVTYNGVYTALTALCDVSAQYSLPVKCNSFQFPVSCFQLHPSLPKFQWPHVLVSNPAPFRTSSWDRAGRSSRLPMLVLRLYTSHFPPGPQVQAHDDLSSLPILYPLQHHNGF